jgi:hypothetical protein
MMVLHALFCQQIRQKNVVCGKKLFHADLANPACGRVPLSLHAI